MDDPQLVEALKLASKLIVLRNRARSEGESDAMTLEYVQLGGSYHSALSSAIGSPASRRATNCSLSSITEHCFHGITSSQKRKKCNPCVRYDLLPMSRVAHARYAWSGITPGPLLRFDKPSHEICSDNSRVVLFVELLFTNTVVLALCTYLPMIAIAIFGRLPRCYRWSG